MRPTGGVLDCEVLGGAQVPKKVLDGAPMGLVAIDVMDQHIDSKCDIWMCGLQQIAQSPHHQLVQDPEMPQRCDFKLVKDEAGVGQAIDEDAPWSQWVRTSHCS